MLLNRILVPTDLSPSCEPAYRWARAIHDLTLGQAEFILLYAPPFPQSGGNFLMPQDMSSDWYTAMLRAAEDELDALAASSHFTGMKVSTQTLQTGDSFPGDEIAAYASEAACDLILLVSRHRGMRSPGGTVLMQIIRETRVPCLVTGTGKATLTGRIGFGTDLSQDSVPAMKSLLELASIARVRVQPFCVNTPATFISQREFQDQARNFSRQAGMPDETQAVLTCGRDIESGMLAYAEDHLCDILALGYGSNNQGIARMFHASVTEFLMGCSEVPLLVLPA